MLSFALSVFCAHDCRPRVAIAFPQADDTAVCLVEFPPPTQKQNLILVPLEFGHPVTHLSSRDWLVLKSG